MRDRERIYHKFELAESLAKALINDMKEYRKAVQDEKALQASEGANPDAFESYLRRMASRFEGIEVTLTRREYWGFIIKSKIEAAGSIGNLDLLQAVYEVLGALPDNSEIGYTGMFDELADGIYGWYQVV